MKKFFVLSVALGLMGCAGAEITTPPVNVVPKDSSAAVGLDVYGKARAAGNPVPRFRGQKTVQIRTRGQGENGSTELSGVPCTLDSGVYTASFTTPANVVVPDYGPNSPALFVRCQTETQSGSSTVNAVNVTAQQRQQNAAGTGVLGAIIVGAVNAAVTDPEKDDFAYPNFTVTLKKKD
jgi:hypothetical protein